MRNSSSNNSSGVVEDIWINTRAGRDEADRPAAPRRPSDPDPVPARRGRPQPSTSGRPGHAHPAASETKTDWDALERENAMLNPDPAIPDRG